MATQPESLDLDDFEEDAPDLDLDDEADDAAQDDAPEPADEQDEADVITFGEAEEVRAEEESEGVRNLRNRLREIERENKALKAGQAPKVDPVGDKPNLDDYWDRPDEYETDLIAWRDRKSNAEKAERDQQQVAEAVEQEIADSVALFERQRASLKVPNFDGAYDKVAEKIGDTGSRILSLVAGEKSAALAYALGNSDERLSALGKFNLGKITDLVRFAAEIGRMAGETRVERRKPATQPESVHRGSSGGGANDATLARLEKRARETGNRTELQAYKRKKGL